jgi:hypothetical protein
MKASGFKYKVLRDYNYDGDKVDAEMDKRFIDREELKKYINKRMLEYDTLEINGEMTPFEKMRCINELLLILELIK